jgi:hypothetical protein
VPTRESPAAKAAGAVSAHAQGGDQAITHPASERRSSSGPRARVLRSM